MSNISSIIKYLNPGPKSTAIYEEKCPKDNFKGNSYEV